MIYIYVYTEYQNTTNKTPAKKTPLHCFFHCLLSWLTPAVHLGIGNLHKPRQEATILTVGSTERYRLGFCFVASSRCKTSGKFGCKWGKKPPSWWMFWKCPKKVWVTFIHVIMMSFDAQKSPPSKRATGKGNISVISDIISYARKKNMLCTCQVVSQGAMLVSGRVYVQ